MRSSILIVLFFLCGIGNLLAQKSHLVSGRVLDSKGNEIQNANILLDGAAVGQSDNYGEFQFYTCLGSHSLTVRHMGFSVFESAINIIDREDLELMDIVLTEKDRELEEFVVTGQFEPMAMKKSIYQVRVISSELIKLRGATNVQTVLNTELGIRFSNDLTLGTSDIQLLGMSGQNVKILLDGIPMLDRGSTRESLGQIDINTIDRIEIVEGPMSVLYGTDALAGVINIITKQSKRENNLSVSARIQEETANDEYSPFGTDGVHNQSIGIRYKQGTFQTEAGLSRNNFGGWQGNQTGRAKAWMPKEQMLYNAGVGFTKNNLKTWYRLNIADEGLQSLGNINVNNNVATDKNYLTKRFFHQLQSEFNPSQKLGFSLAASYTDYSRKTQSTNIDFNTGKRTLSTESGSQDKSVFKTWFSRFTGNWKINENISLLAGLDFTSNTSSGARILTIAPTIKEYALFLAPEFKIGEKLNIRPGFRFIKNTEYDAPPVIPSLNGKYSISKSLDFRFGYARGFRSPDLRELYFTFFDASHSIIGNPDLKAEYSNSFNGSFQWRILTKNDFSWNTTLGGFYNDFNDLISTAQSAENPSITTYINVAKYKTIGFSINNTLNYRNLQLILGFQEIGRYNEYSDNTEAYGELPTFRWTAELNSNITYSFTKIKTQVNFSFKLTGKLPVYEYDGESVKLTNRGSFSMADLSVNKELGKLLQINAGVRNLFNVTNLSNTSNNSSGAHSTGGAVPMSYGRSYFLGLIFNWFKI